MACCQCRSAVLQHGGFDYHCFEACASYMLAERLAEPYISATSRSLSARWVIAKSIAAWRQPGTLILVRCCLLTAPLYRCLVCNAPSVSLTSLWPDGKVLAAALLHTESAADTEQCLNAVSTRSSLSRSKMLKRGNKWSCKTPQLNRAAAIPLSAIGGRLALKSQARKQAHWLVRGAWSPDQEPTSSNRILLEGTDADSCTRVGINNEAALHDSIACDLDPMISERQGLCLPTSDM